MSLPEISRRCVACGAAVRAGARFCPQCGKAVAEGESGVDAAAATAEESGAAGRSTGAPSADAPSTREIYAAAAERESSPSRAGDGARAVPDTGEWRADAGAGESSASPDAEGVAGVPYAQAAPPRPTQPSPLPQPVQTEDGATAEERRGRVARVREEARARVENTRARVERVRDDALVALEETPDDSGLRFVLVTAFLFALFLLFLFLSVTVLR